jgi:hypothetical protein
MEYELETVDVNREVLPPANPDRNPVVCSLHDLVTGIQSAEGLYVGRVRTAVQGLMETLQEQIGKDFKLGADIQNAIQQACREFEASVETADAQWESQRSRLTGDIENVEIRRNPAELIQEIATTEAEVVRGEDRIQAMLRSSSAELAVIMRMRMNHSELKSYLKGLRFQAGRLISTER